MMLERWRRVVRGMFGRKEPAWRRWLRILGQAGRGFYRDRCSLYVSSLTFYTLMSIVPFFALVLAMAGELGLKEHLRSMVLQRFQEQKEVLSEIILFAQKMLEQVHGGLFAAVGALFLFWSVGTLFRNMEETFNRIWEAKPRHWKRRLTDYAGLIFLGPLLLLLSSGAAMFLPKGIVILISYAIFWVLFTLFLFLMPNARVRFSSAVIAGSLTTVLYLALQGAYVYFQKGLSRYGEIYGNFAALPLFLIWVQLSWSIVLFGGEISCAYQEEKDG